MLDILAIFPLLVLIVFGSLTRARTHQHADRQMIKILKRLDKYLKKS